MSQKFSKFTETFKMQNSAKEYNPESGIKEYKMMLSDSNNTGNNDDNIILNYIEEKHTEEEAYIKIEKIDNRVELLHPRILVDNKIDKVPICCSNTSWLLPCCFEDKSDFNVYGLGISIYFQLVKTFILVFLILSIINIPLYAIYYYNSLELTPKSYQDAFFKTTIGNIASSKYP